MIIRQKPPDSRIERQIITYMIVSTKYLQQVSLFYNSNCLSLKFTKQIAEWCIEFYHVYKEAPGKTIESIFRSRTQTNFPDDLKTDIQDFLVDISEEYSGDEKQNKLKEKNINIQYLLEETEKHFRLVSGDYLRVEISKCLVSGDTDRLEILCKNYRRPVRVESTGIDLIRDKQNLIDTFAEDSRETLIDLGGEVGKRLGALKRDYLLTFVGNAGIGKSWWLQQVRMIAILEGLNVAEFSFEVNKAQSTTRTYQWLTGLPTSPDPFYLPQWDCYKNQINSCNKKERTNSVKICRDLSRILAEHEAKLTRRNTKEKIIFDPRLYSKDYRPCIYCMDHKNYDVKLNFDPCAFFTIKNRKQLDLEQAIKKQKKIIKLYNSYMGKYKFECWPALQKSVSDIDTYLKVLEEYDGFIPDVIITDYATKMNPSRIYKEFRHNLSNIFVEHKALALTRHCLVATAHQGNEVRTNKNLKRGSLQESLAPLNESDKLVLINQLEEERNSGMCRLTIGKNRDMKPSDEKDIFVLQCLDIGRPCLKSWAY
jgi:hypothetical protein